MNSIFTVLTLILTATRVLTQNCSEEQFQCGDGKCIRSTLKCNGAIDCLDGKDEDFVICRTILCLDSEFKCTYGACVKSNAVCDGVKDCADNSDELLEKCRNVTTYGDCIQAALYNKQGSLVSNLNYGGKDLDECKRIERSCKNGQLLDLLEHKCDGVVHCADGSDETLEACSSIKCIGDRLHNGQTKPVFKCKYGACVPGKAECNTITQCADGSDELEELCKNRKGLCYLPTNPENGFYIATDIYDGQPGDAHYTFYLNFTCNAGYKLIGNQFPYCSKGRWSDNIPKCVSQCVLRKDPSVQYLCLPRNSDFTEGTKECDELVLDGTTVRPKCREPNYYHFGVLFNMHCKEGEWDDIVVCRAQCGLLTPTGDPQVLGGRKAKRGEIPWHAGIYTKTFDPYKQICGGSLITKSIIISAAHCFWTELDKKLPATNFAVAVGKLYRPWNNAQDKDVQKSDVLEIKIPVRFQGAAANFQEDIALVKVVSPFEFRTYVRPVCVDFDYKFNRRQLRVGALGQVAGWGLTAEDGVESPLLQVTELPYVDAGECIDGSPLEFVELITSDKICAGFNNGTARTVCKGDSGGGLAFAATERGMTRYYLRGVVSTAPTNDHLCNAGVYTTFTQVTKHEEFIKEYLERNQ